MGYHETARAAQELKQVRIERRLAKDELEIMGPVLEFTNQNRGAVNKLKQLLGEIRKVEKHHETRFYKPRIED